MIRALFLAFAQLTDPRLHRVLRLGVGTAVAVYAAMVVAAWWILARTTLFSSHWAESAGDVMLAVAALVLPLPFFPAMATVAMSAQLERVADAVEERHYPSLNWPRPQPWGEVLRTTLRFLAVTVAVNVVALPLYLVLVFTGFAFVLGLIVNGYLLGREYFELVALRRLDAQEARLLFRCRLGRLWLAGMMIAALFSVPFLNLAAPVIATAAMVHLLQTLRPPTGRV
ncbi:MAG: EI24 domain-containing protein [Magnetospirillum sp.]|nr:EI24 domain-containing protein [Magnetospirillum sp.]